MIVIDQGVDKDELIIKVSNEIRDKEFALLNFQKINNININRYYHNILIYLDLEKCFIINTTTGVRNRIEQLVNENIYANNC